MNENNIIKNHDRILNKLLEYRKTYPDFTVSLRQRDSVQSDEGRLQKGYWFTGTDKYLFIGLIKKGDTNNKTKQIGFCLSDPEDLNSKAYLEIVWPGESEEVFINFYEELIAKIDGMKEVKQKKYQKFYDKPFYEAFDEFIHGDYNIIMNSIKQHNLENELIVTEDEFQKALSKIENIRNNAPTVNESINKLEKSNNLNTILYGPPGTGKTFNVINKAVEIIDGECSEDRVTVVKRYNELKEAGQIDFITFHQSFSYEEFIEGIKPDLSDSASDELKYIMDDGVFKSICTRAKIINTSRAAVYDFDQNKINFFKMSLGNSQDDGDEIARYCFENNVIAMGYGEKTDFSKVTTKAEIDKLYSPENDNRTYPTQAVDRFKNWMKIDDIVIISSGNHKVSAIARVKGEYFFDNSRPIDFNHYRNVEWLYKDAVIPVNQILNNKVFSQQTIYEFYKKDLNITNIKSLISTDDSTGEIKPFVLIIDEINRGNISKIFGELITLIEDDKRLGEPNELTVTLPYSKEKFGVPSNLYIIGTMNTADRSIALMDTALRRRFTFIEMMPDLSTLDDLIINGIDIKEMLSKINERIEFLYDRDHTIGHAYFIKLKDTDESEKYPELCNIFAHKIIPLLQEYFYEDWEKIQLVLGDHIKQITGSEKDSLDIDDDVNKKRFIQSRLFKEESILGFNHENYEDRTTYRINPDLNNADINPEAFIKIYKGK